MSQQFKQRSDRTPHCVFHFMFFGQRTLEGYNNIRRRIQLSDISPSVIYVGNIIVLLLDAQLYITCLNVTYTGHCPLSSLGYRNTALQKSGLRKTPN